TTCRLTPWGRAEGQVEAFDSWSNSTQGLDPRDLMGHKEGAYDGWENARASTRLGMTTPDEQEDWE
ncbi:MAG: hypothetical protein M3441_24790, partial [Chloroflexota bacterium]|nr:hypothetical protein [Chloroflexota bacterium]